MHVRLNDRSHEGIGQTPAEDHVSYELTAHLLELPEVKFLHFQDFPLGEIVVLYE